MESSSTPASVSFPKEQTTWHLVGSTAAGAPPQQIPIAGTCFQVGRRADLHLSLQRPNVSKVHAEIHNVGHMLIVKDLQSTNGTYINGRRIESESPLAEGDILQFADAEFRVGCSVPATAEQRTIASSPQEWQWAIASVSALVKERQVIPFFQPIIDLNNGQTVGFEVLARSDIPGLKSPRDMFQAAALMGLEPQLSEISREIGVVASQKLAAPTMLFLNTHPSEHDGQGLIDSLERLSTLKPNVQIVLELHEGAVTDLQQMRELRTELRRLEILLAFDDFGAGQSRLVELAEIAPDFVKFDIGLIREIHQSPPRQQLVGGFLKLCSDLGITSLAEGIEEEAEAQTCRELGFQLAQGYYYGRPAKLENWLGENAVRESRPET